MCCVARPRRIDTCDGPDLLEPGKHIGRRQTHGVAARRHAHGSGRHRAAGIDGALAFIFISLRDSAFMLPIIVSVCYERLDHHQLHLLDVRDDIAQGLRYHKLLFEEIAHQHNANARRSTCASKAVRPGPGRKGRFGRLMWKAPRVSGPRPSPAF